MQTFGGKQFILLSGYSTTGYFENTLFTYRGVYVSSKCFPLALILLWEQSVFLVLANSNLRKLLLLQYGSTVLP